MLLYESNVAIKEIGMGVYFAKLVKVLNKVVETA